MFQILHTLQLLSATSIVTSLGGYENIEWLNCTLPKSLIQFLQTNFAIAKQIQNAHFVRKIKAYSENPSFPSLNSLLFIIDRLSTWRERFTVELSFVLVFEHIPFRLRPKGSTSTYIYRFCARCAFFQMRHKPYYHCQIRRKCLEDILPAKSVRDEILLELICHNCMNLLFNHTVEINPRPWINLDIDYPHD